ncbi:MAG: iron-containing alcohol dehydrogenase [Pelosinus sp.]|nr:iron-containing alcohol dehydrogenase [Pelosinus sp.]
MENTHNFFMSKANLIGFGAIKDLTNELLAWKLKKALIVTDRNMIGLGYVDMIENMLANLFISYDIFDGVLHPNPTVSFVEAGLSFFPNRFNLLSRDYDLIISIGGGTNHDCAKGIAAVATNGGSIIDYEGYNKILEPALPHIAINTTYSAAEVTMFTIITDESRKVKMTIASPNITPFIAVNDPMFTVTMPPEVTAASGMDALCHSIEAYCATEASPLTDALAIGAAKLVFSFLPQAYENGNELKAREQMTYASIMAGMAFNNAGLGCLHSMSHQLGGFYHQVHGTYDGVLLPHIFEFNASSIPESKILKLTKAVGIPAKSKEEAVELVVAAIKKLCRDIGLPSGLKKLGVHESDIDVLAQNAVKDIASFTNPRRATLEDIKKLYLSAL